MRGIRHALLGGQEKAVVANTHAKVIMLCVLDRPPAGRCLACRPKRKADKVVGSVAADTVLLGKTLKPVYSEVVRAINKGRVNAQGCSAIDMAYAGCRILEANGRGLRLNPQASPVGGANKDSVKLIGY